MLRQMSCDQAQGYFYSRPLKLADMQNFTLRNLREYPHHNNPAPRKPVTNQLTLLELEPMAQA
jgi:hypothetical protein